MPPCHMCYWCPCISERLLPGACSIELSLCPGTSLGLEGRSCLGTTLPVAMGETVGTPVSMSDRQLGCDCHRVGLLDERVAEESWQRGITPQLEYGAAAASPTLRASEN